MRSISQGAGEGAGKSSLNRLLTSMVKSHPLDGRWRGRSPLSLTAMATKGVVCKRVFCTLARCCWQKSRPRESTWKPAVRRDVI